MSRGRQWTPEQTAKLREVFDQYSLAELALLFNRSTEAVRQRAAKIGLIRYEKKSESARQVAAQRGNKAKTDDDQKTIYGCMPNALIFLEDNWIELARGIRLRDTMSRSPHHWGTFVIGRGNKED